RRTNLQGGPVLRVPQHPEPGAQAQARPPIAHARRETLRQRQATDRQDGGARAHVRRGHGLPRRVHQRRRPDQD
ncbi:hypothetical protein BN1708_020170, partial [Verticillium longisporum]